MKIALLIIGSEVLQGKIQDTNSKELATTLRNVGEDLLTIQTIADEVEQIVTTLDYMAKKYDVIFTSGGLGPTLDDVTKAALAKLVQSEIMSNHHALEVVTNNYLRGERAYNADTQMYHQLPKDCLALNNPTGFAPGLETKYRNATIFSLPGVPHEFQSILNQEIIPKVFKHKKDHSIVPFTIKTARIPESQIFNQLCPKLWDQLAKFGDVSSLPHFFGVDIGVVLRGSKNEIDKMQSEIKKVIHNSKLSPYVISIDDSPQDLAELIVKKCIDQKIKFGFAESCTGGLNSDRITNIAGSSDVYIGSIVAYSNDIKQTLLNVSLATLQSHGAVSIQCAEEMARGILGKFDLDFAVATTGIAGPGGGSKEKPVGSVAIAVACKNKTVSEYLQLKGNRIILKQRFSQASLLKLWEAISSSPHL